MRTKLAALVVALPLSLSFAGAARASAVTVRHAAIVDCGVHRHAVIRTDGTGREHVTCVATRYQRTVHRAVVAHRSWKKSAAVIGGSTVAGAGVGALVGGGKGALIGAAAGGAAGTVYEVHKRQEHAR